MSKILLVEDNIEILDFIKEFLTNSNYKVVTAINGKLGLDLFIADRDGFDLVITDVMMPVMNGFQMVKEIRKISQVPIIILTALSNEDDQLLAYDLEVDDFLTKPVSYPVLIKKVEAILRRSDSTKRERGIKEFGRYRIDENNLLVYINNQSFQLSVTEFQVFKALLENHNKILTREWLMEHVWNYQDFSDTRIVDTQIKNIRRKLGADTIVTHHGTGYKLGQ